MFRLAHCRWWALRTPVGLAALVWAACASPHPAGGAQAPASQRTAALTHPLAAMPAAAVALPRVRKAIDAVAAAAHPPLASPLPNSSLRTLRRADLPVLLPDDALWLQPGIATAERDWYALSATADGLTIVVQGDRTALVDPEMVPENWTPPTWHAPLVFRNEAIVHATFLAFGAA